VTVRLPVRQRRADIDLTDEEFGRIEAELAKIESTATAPTRTSPSSATSAEATGH